MYDNDIRLDPQLDPDWQSVQIGTPVIASDGKRLGTVQQKRADGLYVVSDSAQADDYMVTPQDIGRVDTDGVRLVVNSSQAMRAQASDPAPGGMAPGAMDREARGELPDRSIGGIDAGAVERENPPS